MIPLTTFRIAKPAVSLKTSSAFKRHSSRPAVRVFNVDFGVPEARAAIISVAGFTVGTAVFVAQEAETAAALPIGVRVDGT